MDEQVEVHEARLAEPDTIGTLRELVERVTAHEGHPPFGDTVWRDLAHPTSRVRGSFARVDGAVVGYLHLDLETARPPTMAIAVDPGASVPEVSHALVEHAMRTLKSAGAPTVMWWVLGATAETDALVADAGFSVSRELWQMRVRLPVPGRASLPDGVTLRSFVPGEDDGAWLVVNNRAFAADPDQGGWSHETLAERLREPWFDPQGFLLAVDRDGLAGFCWTKVHEPAPPVEPQPLGEIYAIGVDPSRQGIGLGRALVVSGLNYLHDVRGMRVGMLFVDAANRAAVALYRDLGFETTRVDRAYARAIER